MIHAIKIIHPQLQEGAKNFLADFFRMTGIFVCSRPLNKDNGKPDCDAIIIVHGSQTDESAEWLNLSYPDAFWVNETNIERLDQVQRQKFLKNCINCLHEKGTGWPAFELNALKKLAEIYVEYGFQKHLYIHSNFFEDKAEIQAVQDVFTKVYIAISQACKGTNPYSAILGYARIYLTRLLNETCTFLSQRLLFDTKKCIHGLDGALQADPQFANAMVLKGLMADVDYLHQYEGGAYYRAALKMTPPQAQYMAYPNYRIGRFFEKTGKDLKEAEKYYQTSANLNPQDYKAHFKLAALDKRDGQYQEAIAGLQAVQNILHPKYQANYMRPQEYEYLFRSLLMAENIYRLHLNGAVAASLADETSKEIDILMAKIISGAGTNLAYDQIFGPEAEKYLKKTHDRLKSKRNCIE